MKCTIRLYVKNKFIVLLRFDPTSIFWYLSFILVEKKVPFIQYLLHHYIIITDFTIIEKDDVEMTLIWKMSNDQTISKEY